MQSVSAASLLSPTTAPKAANSFSDMGSGEFLKLLITQLTSQDPMQPMGNEELLRQISSIREIELSTTLTDSLRKLTGQQNVTAASSMVGQYVTGAPGSNGQAGSGLVVGVRFVSGGSPVLLLSNGVEMPIEQVSLIQPPRQAAEALIGRNVVGFDQRDPKKPQVVQGLVTAARVDDKGEAFLELDTGAELRLRDLVSVTTGATA
jgi:flagellar basal-body rod modification protein FlgD